MDRDFLNELISSVKDACRESGEKVRRKLEENGYFPRGEFNTIAIQHLDEIFQYGLESDAARQAIERLERQRIQTVLTTERDVSDAI